MKSKERLVDAGFVSKSKRNFEMRFLGMTLLTASLALSSSAQLNKPSVTEFDAPDAAKVSSPACAPNCGTIAFGNNSLGQIVGFYTDRNVVPHGFLRTPDGQIISFDAPGAGLGYGLDQGTVAYSINDQGVIAGQFQDSSYLFHAFLRYADGSFTTFDAPDAGTGASQGTLAFNVNLEGATAGIYIDGSGVYHGYVLSPFNKFTSFDPRGSIYTYTCQETCLSPDGTITGFWEDSAFGVHGFVRAPNGAITVFDPTGAPTGAGAQLTVAASINAEGVITGYFLGSDGGIHGFLRSSGGTFTTFDVPSHTGAVETAAFSINSFGAVTGEFLDASNVMHGFSRSPEGTFATFNARGAGTAASQGTRPSTNNSEGAVTGWWIDADNLNHGFVWYPSNPALN